MRFVKVGLFSRAGRTRKVQLQHLTSVVRLAAPRWVSFTNLMQIYPSVLESRLELVRILKSLPEARSKHVCGSDSAWSGLNWGAKSTDWRTELEIMADDLSDQTLQACSSCQKLQNWLV